MERQQERLLAAAAGKGYELVATVREQASGLNEKRRGLRRLLRLATVGEIDVVRIEFKDRLVGSAYIVEALGAHGARVEVLDGPVATEAAQERVADMRASVTCFAARLYGSRLQQLRQKVKDAAKEAEGIAG